MSIVFGGIRQLGMVVRDAEAAMREWGKLGVGPFFVVKLQMDDFHYYGQPGTGPVVSLCFAHSGPLQIELIQQHNDVPSVYRDFLANGRQGPQHVASWFADHASYDAKRQEMLDRGFRLAQEGGSRAADARFSYFQTDEPGGLMIELTEALMPIGDQMRAAMESAAQAWDGKELVASRNGG